MRRTTVILASMLAALLVTGLVALIAGKSAEAAFPGTNGKIAFSRDNFSVAPGTYTVDPAGGEPVRIGDSTTDLDYSPDGTKIAFAYSPDPSGLSPEVWVMDADGTNRVQLTNTAGTNREPAWYPGGRKLAIEGRRPGKGTDVYAVSLNASHDRVVGTERLTNGKQLDGEPAISPNGERLAFRRSSSIFVMRANTPEGRRNRPAKVVSPGNLGSFGSPDWSPDGRRIVFDGHADAFRELIFGVGVYSVAPDGRHKRFLADFGDSMSGEGDPVYSPDGKQIIYSQNGLWLMNPDGTDQTLFTPPGVTAKHPTWQPLP